MLRNREPQRFLIKRENSKKPTQNHKWPRRGVPTAGVYLLAPDPEGQGVCPAAQRGHFHVNSGPSVPGGVTLATVKAIVPAGSECEKERLLKSERLKLNGTTNGPETAY